LDGFPITYNQAMLLEKAQFHPQKLYNIIVGTNTILERAKRQRELEE
jgi:hypothetical protein